MKVIYIAFDIDIVDYQWDGVYKKIKGQQHALVRLGHTCDICLIGKENMLLDSKDNVLYHNIEESSFSYYLSEVVKDYDVSYIRMGLGHPKFRCVIDILKKEGVGCIMEIPTYPFASEMLSVAKDKFVNKKMREGCSILFATALYTWFYFPQVLKKIDLVAAISSKKINTKNKVVYINNGISIDSSDLIGDKIKKEKDFIEVLVVAKIRVWHGIDRAIKGLADYYRNTDNMPKIRLNIVGDGDQIENLEQLTKELNLQDYVLFHGKKFGEELRNMYKICDFAMASLGLHRLKCNNASTLKSREYCMQGIPFIISESDILPQEVKGAFRVKSDDSNLDFTQIIKWYNSLVLPDASRELKEMAAHNFTWESEMRKVISTYLEGEKE